MEIYRSSFSLLISIFLISGLILGCTAKADESLPNDLPIAPDVSSPAISTPSPSTTPSEMFVPFGPFFATQELPSQTPEIQPSRFEVQLIPDPAIGVEFQQYHTYDEYRIFLEGLSLDLGCIGLEEIGKSNEGRPILAIGIGNPAAQTEVLVMGLHHAFEWQSGEMCLYLAHQLLHAYQDVDGPYQELLQNSAVWIVPMVNPDGFLESGGGEPAFINNWRKNRRLLGDLPFDRQRDGVDLNRNYGFKWQPAEDGQPSAPGQRRYPGEAPFSEPETQAIRDFALAHHFKVSIALHSYGDLLYFPWGYTNELCPDFATFMILAEGIARNSRLEILLEALSGPTPGNSDDYLYGELGIYAFTEEMGATSSTNPGDLLGLLEEKLPGLLYAIQQAPYLPPPIIAASP